MTAATSSAVPHRPIGDAAPAARSGSVSEGVSNHPGATPFTVIPNAADSIASARVRPIIPAFAAA